MNLTKILKDHELWLDSNGKEGERADLEGANLTNANLRGANLYRAYLTDANLSGANLDDIKGKQILTFSAGKHFAYACDGNIKIGCETMTISEWLDTYEQIGEQEGYTKQQIKDYGAFIKLARVRR